MPSIPRPARYTCSLIILLGCGSGNGGAGPNEECPYTAGGFVSIFRNPANVLDAEIALDGVVHERVTRSVAQQLTLVSLNETCVSAGAHLVVVRVRQQVQSPATYDFAGSLAVVETRTNSTRVIDVQRTKAIAPGDTVVIRMAVP